MYTLDLNDFEYNEPFSSLEHYELETFLSLPLSNSEKDNSSAIFSNLQKNMEIFSNEDISINDKNKEIHSALTDKNEKDIQEIYNPNSGKAQSANNISPNSLPELGKKRKRFRTINHKNLEIKRHTKYDEDNIRKKIKIHFKDQLLDFINSKIIEDIFFFINHGKQKLLNINPKNFNNTSIEYNKKLLHTKIKDIFRDEIDGRLKNFPKDHNKNLIEKIFESENGETLKSILDLEFLVCLRYYRKDENLIEKYDCLKGFEENFDNLRKKLAKNNDESYIGKYFKIINNFEKLINKKNKKSSKKSTI